MSASKGLMQAASGVSTGPGAGNAWDISTAQLFAEGVNVAKFSAFDNLVAGIFFKPDGTKLFMSGFTNDNVYEFNLSTAFDLATMSFVQSFDISPQDTDPFGIFFKPDGTKMFFAGIQNDRIYEYDLSTAWDISSASFNQSLDVSSQETNPQGLFFKSDGTGLYICGSGGDEVNQYSLSTAWDISSASHVRAKSVSAQETSPTGLFFKDDGTEMYITGSGGDEVNQFTLSTAYDISSASFSHNFDVSSQESAPRSVIFKPDGTKMYVAGTGSDSIIAYDLSTAWDISSASFNDPTTKYFNVSSQDTFPMEIFFKPDGSKMYIAGNINDAVFEYDLSTSWDVTSASFLQSFSVSAKDDILQGVFFRSDGAKMYVTGSRNDKVYEYNLSTAWDISSASFVQDFSVASQENSPSNVFFKTDGTKMFICGTGGDEVNEYDLSTAWNISSASYSQTFDTSPQSTNTDGLFFRDDGLKMYISDIEVGEIFEYDLSTAWDISSASYLQNFVVTFQEPSPRGLFFKGDGLKMYITGNRSSAIYEYDL